MSAPSSAPAPVVLYAQIVGNVVRSQRTLRGISLSAMAEQIGFSASGWSRIETGDTTMTVAHLRSAAKMLNLEPSAVIQSADTLAARFEAAGIPVHTTPRAGGPRR